MKKDVKVDITYSSKDYYIRPEGGRLFFGIQRPTPWPMLSFRDPEDLGELHRFLGEVLDDLKKAGGI